MIPGFLDLSARAAKPRVTGLTHVLDKGITVAATEALLESASDFVDIWKLGWGTAYVDRGLKTKLALLAEHDVSACLGGTALEIAWDQGQAAACLDWAYDAGFPCVEVSRGTVAMPIEAKHELIALAGNRFRVLSEVGVKDPAVHLTPEQWVDEVAGDLAHGAQWVVAEGRESGTVGLYNADGSPRPEVVAAVVEGAGGHATVLFEAPRKDQQAWLIRSFGSDVNLANIPVDEVVALETLRLGLRADTYRCRQPTDAR